MHTRFILGPAGGGKTFRCLAEIRDALRADPDGPPLLLLAPKQSTYQLERQLLSDGSVAGYTRLQILSFERLAFYVFGQLRKPAPRMLNEQGRLMVLRALLAKRRDSLKLFRASSRLTGFAQHLSAVLSELQHQQQTPESLNTLAEAVRDAQGLSLKLQDIATLLGDYQAWLQAHQLQDADCVIDSAVHALRAPGATLECAGLWVDGFTDFPPQELELLAEIVQRSKSAVITFCLEKTPAKKISWLNHWSVVEKGFEKCKQRLARLPSVEVTTEVLPQFSGKSRFAPGSALQHLESRWADPVAMELPPASLERELCSVCCSNPLGEAVMAAREILKFVRAGAPVDTAIFGSDLRSPRPTTKEWGEGQGEGPSQRSFDTPLPNPPPARSSRGEGEKATIATASGCALRAGGRYRDVAVLTRDLESFHDTVTDVFNRYGIPHFLDRRESVSHHALAELSGNALRAVVSNFAHKDFFGALKTGLFRVPDADVDRLENETLAFGWKGAVWQKPLVVPDDPTLSAELETLRRKIVPPFNHLSLALGPKPDGAQMASAFRQFWTELEALTTLQEWSSRKDDPSPIHLTVWEQMNAWLDNVELAFAGEPLPLKEWLPILDAGIAGLSVGVIPPALDQVSIGAIDRSRNDDARLVILLGMNETIFPAPPAASVLLTDADRAELEEQGISLMTARQHQAKERFHAYSAFTRARARLVLSHSAADSTGKSLDPSPFLAHVKKLFPQLVTEKFNPVPDWRESVHACELAAPLLRNKALPPGRQDGELSALLEIPALSKFAVGLEHFTIAAEDASLSPATALKLYGRELKTSVSRMEQFASCPFKFFVHSGLRASERKKFEIDNREQGNFQHDVLKMFHEQLKKENLRWRDITPESARERIRGISEAFARTCREGLFHSSEEGRFAARMLSGSLQYFVEILVGWMQRQYAFDPVAVELPFGEDESAFPAWTLDLGGGLRLLLRGRIDRIDLFREEGSDEAACVVVDYKSSGKKLDDTLMLNGVQLQLPAYLGVLRNWKDPAPLFGVRRLRPAGVFYVNLRGKFDSGQNRDEALLDPAADRRLAYRHHGRFNILALDKLDTRGDAKEGDQFNYRRNKDNSVNANSREALKPDDFDAMLKGVEDILTKMGRAVYEGKVSVDPFRHGSRTACEYCEYGSVCRIDPWTHQFRALPKADEGEGNA